MSVETDSPGPGGQASEGQSPDLDSDASAGSSLLEPASEELGGQPSHLEPRPGRLARSFFWASLGVPLGDLLGVFALTFAFTVFFCFPISIYRSAATGPGTFILFDGTTIVTTSPADSLRVLEEHRGGIRSARFEKTGPFRSDNVALSAFVALPLAFVAWTVYQKGPLLRLWFRVRWRGVLLGAAGGVVLVIAGFAWQRLVTMLGYPPPDVASFLRESFPWTIVIGVGGILAPLGEEMYFRGRLLDLLDARLGRTGAALLSAAAFGLLHGIPVLVPVLFAFGVLLAVLRRLSGGLVAPFVAHAVNNLLGLLLSYALMRS